MKVNEIITEKILAAMEKGVIPWQKPWKSEPPRNISGREYTGINVILLEMDMLFNGWRNPVFLTYNQAKELGGYVNKGEKGNMVVFYKTLIVNEDEITEKTIPLLRYYYVFNAEQCELPEKIISKIKEGGNLDFVPVEKAEEIINGYVTCPTVIQGDHAAYSPSKDIIIMPKKENFVSEESYYCTFFHEAIHSTGHKNRLNRHLEKDINKGEQYAKEELVAEIGACSLCAEAGIDKFENSAAYIKSWMEALKNDKSLIIKAASTAQKAVNYIKGGCK